MYSLRPWKPSCIGPEGKSAPRMRRPTFRQFLKKAGAEYRARLGTRLARIEHAWRGLTPGAGVANAADLERELHSIAGSAETFGLPELSRAARAAESAVQRYRARVATPTPAQRARFERLLAALKRAALGR